MLHTLHDRAGRPAGQVLRSDVVDHGAARHVTGCDLAARVQLADEMYPSSDVHSVRAVRSVDND